MMHLCSAVACLVEDLCGKLEAGPFLAEVEASSSVDVLVQWGDFSRYSGRFS